MLPKLIRNLVLGGLALCQFATALASELPLASASGRSSYVLADSIGLGLQLDKLEARLQARLGGPSLINYGAGRSITHAGSPQDKSALASVAADREIIAKASVIIIILGMEQREASFADSQQELMRQLKSIAPQASYYWVDIGATISVHAANWSARNKIIYDNAGRLGYSVVSRYKAIFGADADPLNIQPGQNFPGWSTEAGFGGPGNVHGFDAELSLAIVAALDAADAQAACRRAASRRSYVLGDSIAYGLQMDGLALKLQERLGGASIINYDGGRSINHRGGQIEKSALESVEIDREFIASAHVVVIVLGTNQLETSFAQSQRQLLQALKAIAPHARYYWVDIGATLATQVQGWSARNKIIYDNAAEMGYSVISRYKAIFGPRADPLRIVAGQDFPASTADLVGWPPDNIHGAYGALSRAILEAVSSGSCAVAN